MAFDPEIKQPSAFAEVNNVYDSALRSWNEMGISGANASGMAKETADKFGGEELQEYNHSEALKDIQDIASRQYTPNTIKQTNEELGLERPDSDTIVSSRYDEEGQELVAKMITKADEMKKLYTEDISNASDYEVGKRILSLLEKGLFTPIELNTFYVARDKRQASQAKITLEKDILSQPDTATQNKRIDQAVSTNRMSIKEAVEFREAHGLISQEEK